MASLLETLARSGETNDKGPAAQDRLQGKLNQIGKNLYYFPLMRMISQQFGVSFDPASEAIGNHPKIKVAAEKFDAHVQKLAGVAGPAPENPTARQTLAKKILSVLPFSRDVENIRHKNKRYDLDKAGLFGRNLLNVGEAIIFSLVTSLSRHLEHNDLRRDFGALAAHEQGKAVKDVTYGDLKKSQNPFVKAELKKSGQKYVMRYASDAAFVMGPPTGIVAKSLTYPLEYGMFRQTSPIEDMRRIIQDTQENKLGSAGVGKDTLVANMTRMLQGTLAKNNYEKLDEARVAEVSDHVLRPLAAHMLEGKANISDFAYIFSELSSDAAQVVQRAQGKLATLGVTAPAPPGDAAATPQAESELSQGRFMQKHLESKGTGVNPSPRAAAPLFAERHPLASVGSVAER